MSDATPPRRGDFYAEGEKTVGPLHVKEMQTVLSKISDPRLHFLQHYLGHKNIQHTVRYTELSPDRFRDFWRG